MSALKLYLPCAIYASMIVCIVPLNLRIFKHVWPRSNFIRVVLEDYNLSVKVIMIIFIRQ